MKMIDLLTQKSQHEFDYQDQSIARADNAVALKPLQ